MPENKNLTEGQIGRRGFLKAALATGIEDQPIEGLYAIGNVSGNFFGNDYPLMVPGLSHGRCLTFGRLIGQAVANGTLV